MYYGNYRFHYRHKWLPRTLDESLPDMEEVDQEDRVTVRRQKASESGFTGTSILHRLHLLYNFNILEDFVFDAMHTILLRNIKRHLDFYKESGFLNDNVEKGLSNMPWTAGT